MKKGISTFIKGNKIASIAYIDEGNKPHSFHCFYVFDEINYLLFFKSSSGTYHAKSLSNNSCIAGSILPHKIDFLALKGVQFTGSIITENIPGNVNPDSYYHKKSPLAIAKPGHVWCIQLQMVKMTDNTNVFGEKLRWQKAI
jgi:uncharacterized protein